MKYGVHKIWPPIYAVTLISDRLNLIRSSVEASEYSMYVLSRLFKPITRYHDNQIRLEEQMNAMPKT